MSSRFDPTPLELADAQQMCAGFESVSDLFAWASGYMAGQFEHLASAVAQVGDRETWEGIEAALEVAAVSARDGRAMTAAVNKQRLRIRDRAMGGVE